MLEGFDTGQTEILRTYLRALPARAERQHAALTRSGSRVRGPPLMAPPDALRRDLQRGEQTGPVASQVGTTMPMAATTWESSARAIPGPRTGTAIEQAPSVISSTVVA